MKAYVLEALKGAALCLAFTVAGGLLASFVLEDENQRLRQRTDEAEDAVTQCRLAAHSDATYFQICLDTLERASKVEDACMRRLRTCYGADE